jgi:hypothetical protein
MDKTDAIVALDYGTVHEAVSASPADAETTPGIAAGPTFDLFVAMQKRGTGRPLDAQLVDLIVGQAASSAVLTPREQAAIAWVEAVISSGKPHSADGAYAALRRFFDEAAIVKLTALAGTVSARSKLGAWRRG